MIDKGDSPVIVMVIAVAAVLISSFICASFGNNVNSVNAVHETICIGGYEYELVVNEFNEPVWCWENAE